MIIKSLLSHLNQHNLHSCIEIAFGMRDRHADDGFTHLLVQILHFFVAVHVFGGVTVGTPPRRVEARCPVQLTRRKNHKLMSTTVVNRKSLIFYSGSLLHGAYTVSTTPLPGRFPCATPGHSHSMPSMEILYYNSPCQCIRTQLLTPARAKNTKISLVLINSSTTAN